MEGKEGEGRARGLPRRFVRGHTKHCTTSKMNLYIQRFLVHIGSPTYVFVEILWRHPCYKTLTCISHTRTQITLTSTLFSRRSSEQSSVMPDIDADADAVHLSSLVNGNSSIRGWRGSVHMKQNNSSTIHCSTIPTIVAHYFPLYFPINEPANSYERRQHKTQTSYSNRFCVMLTFNRCWQLTFKRLPIKWM